MRAHNVFQAHRMSSPGGSSLAELDGRGRTGQGPSCSFPFVMLLVSLAASLQVATAEAQWRPDGIPICLASGKQAVPSMTSDGDGNFIIVWRDWRDGGSSIPDIFAQKVSAAGELLWGPDGVLICNGRGTLDGPAVAPDGAGGAIVTWCDNRSGTYDVYAQRISADGAAQWSSAPLRAIR
jgi:hypothetical protein